MTEPTTDLRARSCPTCHSIGEPRTIDRTLGGNEPILCRDPWHQPTPELRPRYMPISPRRLADGEAKRTVQASETVNVDVAPDGRVLGVECLTGHANTTAAMFVALQALRVAP